MEKTDFSCKDTIKIQKNEEKTKKFVFSPV